MSSREIHYLVSLGNRHINDIYKVFSLVKSYQYRVGRIRQTSRPVLDILSAGDVAIEIVGIVSQDRRDFASDVDSLQLSAICHSLSVDAITVSTFYA